jgi:hypothetical protein
MGNPREEGRERSWFEFWVLGFGLKKEQPRSFSFSVTLAVFEPGSRLGLGNRQWAMGYGLWARGKKEEVLGFGFWVLG